MAIRNIVKEGDPILNKVCRPVTNFDDRLATLLDDMRETMIDADGVGLAGPQVGMLRRLFVVWDTTDAPEEIPADYEYKFIDFVNPEILAVSEDEETAYEGCLSFPGHNGAVTRPAAPAHHLRDEAEHGLIRPEALGEQERVDAEDAHQGHILKIQPLGHHLGAHHDVVLVVCKLCQQFFVSVLGGGGVLVHPQDARLREELCQLLLSLLGAEAPVLQLAAASRADRGRRVHLAAAVVAQQLVG